MTAPTEQPIATRFFSGVPRWDASVQPLADVDHSCRSPQDWGCRRVNAQLWSPTASGSCGGLPSLADGVVVLWSGSRPCTYAPRSATRTRAAPSTCTSGSRPAEIKRSMVRTETPSCSAASLLVISSRPDTVAGSNAVRQGVKDWHILTFPDTSCRPESGHRRLQIPRPSLRSRPVTTVGRATWRWPQRVGAGYVGASRARPSGCG